MIGDHVAREADPARSGATAQLVEGGRSAEVRSDDVVVERVRGGECVRVAPSTLDLARRPAPLPQPDEPKPGHASPGEPIELLIGDLGERPHLAGISPRQLVKPDVGALGHEHELGHPGEVVAEALRFGIGLETVAARSAEPEVERSESAARSAGPRAATESCRLLRDDAEANGQPVEQAPAAAADDRSPMIADVGELSDEGAGHGPRRRAEERDEILTARPDGPSGGEVSGQRCDSVAITRAVGPRQRPVVDEHAEITEGRVRCGEPGEEQLAAGRFVVPIGWRERRAVGTERRVRRLVAEFAAHAGRARGEGGAVDFGQVALDDDPVDLVEESEGEHLAGEHPVPRSGDREPVGDLAGDRRFGQPDRFDRTSGVVESVGRPGRRRKADPVGAGCLVHQPEMAAAVAARSAWDRSIARRSSSRPDGSNS